MSYVTRLHLDVNPGGARVSSGAAAGQSIGTDLAANGIIETSPTAGVQFQTDGILPGDIAEVRDNIDANNGFYVVIDVPSESRVDVAFTFTPVVDADDFVRIFRDTEQLHAATAITTAFAADNVIVASGATFRASGVKPGDIAIISADTNNNGAYLVDYVSQDGRTLYVQTIDEGVVTFTAGAATGNVTVTQQYVELVVTDELSPTWTAAAAAHPIHVDKHPVFSRDLFYDVVLVLPTKISYVRSGATDTDWAIEKEIVILNRPTASAVRPVVEVPAGDPGNQATLTLGTVGPDRVGASNPSVFLGWAPATISSHGSRFKFNSYGSMFGSISGTVLAPQSFEPGDNDPDLIASLLISDALNLGFGVPGVGAGVTGARIESLNHVPQHFGIVASGQHDIENYTLSRQPGVALVSGTDGVLIGLLKSSQSVSPLFTSLGATTFTVLDPRADYTTQELFTLVGSSVGNKIYTWNPRFLRTTDAAPIAGLAIRVQALLGGNPILGPTTHVTTAAGGLNGDLGIQLTAGVALSGVGHFVFTYRITVTNGVTTPGRNYRARTFDINMRARLDVDYGVEPAGTDFEGEVSF